MDATEDPPAVVPVNPFSPTAVARVAEGRAQATTVTTAAIRDALAHLDHYLRSGDGGTVAVVGDYGTGKTHLAAELLAHAQESTGGAIRAVYLDAPADTFLSLSRQLLGRLSRDAVRALVEDHRAASPAVTAPDGSPAAGWLGERLRAELAPVTTDPSVGTVLAMLLDPATEATAWDWLTGHPPGPRWRRPASPPASTWSPTRWRCWVRSPCCAGSATDASWWYWTRWTSSCRRRAARVTTRWPGSPA
ncbi:ATP-binding protein [Verrucosispora sioxanthis]|uniref:ATP-binding protein n=1 Tax=Verrucosispora sioxanthis TaxID=2499994 RepID=UPI001C1248C4|nr:ATP-binding protein [Verrucosispora sioxanthis]